MLALAILSMLGAAAFDYVTTERVVRLSVGFEKNPFLAPFVALGSVHHAIVKGGMLVVAVIAAVRCYELAPNGTIALIGLLAGTFLLAGFKNQRVYKRYVARIQ